MTPTMEKTPRAISRLTGTLVVVVLLVAAAAITWGVIAQRRNGQTGQRPTMQDRAPTTQGMAGMKMSDRGTVQLNAAQIAQFGITFGTVEERTLSAEARTIGVVAFDETRVSTVTTRYAGFVERLHADFTGQRVREGQPLLEIYSPELVAAQEELLVARRLQRSIGESAVPGVPASTTDLVSAARERLGALGIATSQIDEVLSTGTVRRTVTLHSPASGIVVEKPVLRGQAVAAGVPLYTIADLSVVWVDAELRESDAALVRVGTAADIEINGAPGRQLRGRVGFVYPTLDAPSRSIRARITVANSNALLKPGMYATVRFYTPTQRVLTVPSSAVIQTGERSIVFVDMGGGQLMMHAVRIGRISGGYTEIVSGVDAGNRVVTSAQFLLESESNIADVMRAVMGQMGAGDRGAMQDMPGMKKGDMDMKGADAKGMPTAPRPDSGGR